MFLGVDTGGTFTDFVLAESRGDTISLRTHKVLSTPDAPERAILQGIEQMGLQQAVAAGQASIIHGSTVATNAALENKGVRTAFITNRGFRDLLTIARQTRPDIYALYVPPLPIPVPRPLCLECGGRVDARGKVKDPLTEDDIQGLIDQLHTLKPEAIAICFLFSFLDESHEQRLEAALKSAFPDTFISRSSAVLPEYREYERGITTWLNASLGPLVEGYLLRLKARTAPSRLAVMQSSGGIMRAEHAAQRAVNLLLSGPAGGLAAAQALAQTTGHKKLMTFDMGGTSTDVALLDGKVGLSSEGKIGPWPVAVPMVDMHTIGAGGGSIAYTDSGGMLHVGPRSAGAQPGPACYGNGGTEPTVTDANVVLGRLPATVALGGAFSPDKAAALSAVGRLAAESGLSVSDTAQGIISLANEHMARALRVISVEQGYNPADFRLCCFGGAGGLHLCALAQALGMSKAVIPANAGVLSAMGMLMAPVERQYSRTHTATLTKISEQSLSPMINNLKEIAIAELREEGFSAEHIHLNFSADLRYQGQSSTLNLAWDSPGMLIEAFSQAHEQRYGHALSMPVELVNIRLQALCASALKVFPEADLLSTTNAMTTAEVSGYAQPVPVFQRQTLGRHQQISGPLIVLEPTSTSFIDAGWTARVDSYGNLQLEKTAASTASSTGK